MGTSMKQLQRPDDADPAGLYLLVAIWIGAVVLTVLSFQKAGAW